MKIKVKKGSSDNQIIKTTGEQFDFNHVPGVVARMHDISMCKDIDSLQKLNDIILLAKACKADKKEFAKLNDESKRFIKDIIHNQLFFKMAKLLEDNPHVFKQITQPRMRK